MEAESCDTRRLASSAEFIVYRPGNGSPSATNVVLDLVVLLVVIRFSVPQGSVVSQPIVIKLFTHINDNILHQATWRNFDYGPN